MTPVPPVEQSGSSSIEQTGYWWYDARNDLLRAGLGEWVGRPARVLDVGSADGPSARWLPQHGRVAVDLDVRGLVPGRDACASALALPFRDATFDVVAAFDVIEHCEPEATALDEVRRVLRPGGHLVLSMPAYSWAWTDFDVANGLHRRYTTARAAAAVERAGFDTDRVTYAFASVFPMFAAERAARRLTRRRAHGPADIVELPQLPGPLNTALLALSRIDRAVLARRDLPFGSSVFLAATRVS